MRKIIKKRLYMIMWKPPTQMYGEGEYIPGENIPILYDQKKDGTFIVKHLQCNEFLRPGTFLDKKQLKKMVREQ